MEPRETCKLLLLKPGLVVETVETYHLCRECWERVRRCMQGA